MFKFYDIATMMLKNGTVYIVTVIGGDLDGKCLTAEKILIRDKEVVAFTSGLVDISHDIAAAAELKSAPYTWHWNGLTLFTEPVAKRPRLILLGGGHVALAAARLAELLDFHVTVIDDRPEFANQDRFPGATTLCCPFETGLNKIEYDEACYFVIVTNGHLHDRLCLEIILKNKYAYVGMIGSKRKVNLVTEQMEKNGYRKEALETVHAPIGLQIGAQTPAEIAVSIFAEIIAIKNKNGGGSYWDDDIISAFKNNTSNIYAVATITGTKGSTARKTGAKMVILQDGKTVGTIGGGAAENQVIEVAKAAIKDLESQMIYCDMLGTDATKSDMICGGSIDVFIDVCKN